jgi:hypothetical protein
MTPPVTTLDELKQILNSKPLLYEELDELFIETDEARDPTISRRDEIAEILKANPNAKVLLAGHGGTGKSTELVKFRADHQDRFTFVQLSVSEDGDPATVNVEGLLVLIVEAVLRQMRDLEIKFDESSLEEIYGWFDKTFQIREESRAHSAEAGGGVATQGSFLGKLLGLTATLRAGIKLGSTMVAKTVREEESRIRDLAAHCGALLTEVALAVFEHNANRLVLIVEDLDKVPVGPADRLFIDNPTPLAGLPVPAVFTAPIFLFFNPRATSLDSHFAKVMMTMIKVEDQNGEHYEPGWRVIRDILAHRVDLSACIDDDAVDLVIAKTGGVLRHLFEVLRTAALAAGQDYKRQHRSEERIRYSDVRYGLDRLTNDIIRSIGVMGLPEEFKNIRTDDLYKRLEDFRSPRPAQSNRINLLLMQAHALLEYNGKRWHRVHPLVAEYLEEEEERKKRLQS